MSPFRIPQFDQLLTCLYFAIEFLFFFRVLLSRLSRLKKGLVFFSAFVLYLLLMGIVRNREYFIVLCLHAALIAGSAFLLHKAVKLSLCYSLFLSTAFIICRGVWNEQLQELLFPLSNHFPMHLQATVNFLITLLILEAMRRFFIRMDNRRTMSGYELFLEMFPACTIFMVRIGIYHYVYFLKDFEIPAVSHLFSWFGAFLALASLVLLASSELCFANLAARHALERSEQQQKQQMRMFQEQRDHDERLKALRHDMANHLKVLESLASLDDVQGYIHEIRQEINTGLQQIDTGNLTLNALLWQKAQACREAGVTLEAAVLFPEEKEGQKDLLSPMEIVTLFANGIDNALEALSAAQVSDKTIRVTGSVRHGSFVVRFENACAFPPSLENGLPASSKQEEGHGYGLRNMQQVLESHDGAMDIQVKENRFILTWMIPLAS